MIVALATLLLAQPPDLPAGSIEEIVVSAPTPNASPLPGPIDQFRRHCFEPQRRNGRGDPPDPDDAHWRPLGDEVRERLGIDNPDAVLFGLADHVRGHSLVLHMDRVARPQGLAESRCIITVIGGTSHGELQEGMAALFRGPGTDRHVGASAGVPDLPGWRQQVWTAMPERGSSGWRDVSAGSRRSGGTFIVVTDVPTFYRHHYYVLGDLKTRTGLATPVSILSLSVTRLERSARR